MNFETVIGLEVHVELKTKSKIFSSSPTPFGAEANTQTSVIDLGYPGVVARFEQRSGRIRDESRNGFELRNRNGYEV